jgi:hypothetical protein
MNPVDPAWQFSLTVCTGAVVAVLGAYIIALTPRAGVRARFTQRLVALFVGWFLLSLGLSVRGFFQAPLAFQSADIGGFLVFGTLMSVPVLAFVLAQQRSAQFRQLAAHASIAFLVGLQFYRVAGIVFWGLWRAGLLPTSFALITAGADLLIGLSAPILAWGIVQQRTWARPATLLWCVVGLCDFAIAVPTIGLSLFGLIALSPAPSLIGFHPLALISLVNVPLAICLHLLVLQRLRAPQPAPTLLVQ